MNRGSNSGSDKRFTSFSNVQTVSGVHTAYYLTSTSAPSRGYNFRDRTLTSHPHLSLRLRVRGVILLVLFALTACTEKLYILYVRMTVHL